MEKLNHINNTEISDKITLSELAHVKAKSKAKSKAVESKAVESKAVESKAVESKAVESKHVKSKKVSKVSKLKIDEKLAIEANEILLKTDKRFIYFDETTLIKVNDGVSTKVDYSVESTFVSQRELQKCNVFEKFISLESIKRLDNKTAIDYSVVHGVLSDFIIEYYNSEKHQFADCSSDGNFVKFIRTKGLITLLNSDCKNILQTRINCNQIYVTIKSRYNVKKNILNLKESEARARTEEK